MSEGKYIDEEDMDGGGKTIDAGDDNGGSTKTIDEGDSRGASSKTIDIEDDEEEKPLMEQVMDYCRTRDFLKIFEDYIINHIKYFKDATDDEHRLEWTKIFEDYLKLFEDVLAQFIDKKGGNYAAFYRQCREKQESGTPEEKHFLKLLSPVLTTKISASWSGGSLLLSNWQALWICPSRGREMDDKYQDPRLAKENSGL